MRRFLLAILIVSLILSLPPISMGGDSKELLTLKQEVLRERAMRIQAQLGLMQAQFKDGQEALSNTQKELAEVDKKLREMESKKEVTPQPAEGKKNK